MQDVQNKQAQAQNLLPAGAKRSIADFGNGFDHTTWKVTHLGEGDSPTAKALDRGQNTATINLNKRGNFRFKGTALSGLVHIGSPACMTCTSPMPVSWGPWCTLG